MDIFGTTITAVHEIYAVAMFIKGIVDDVRSYESDKSDILARLSHEFLFFEYFKSMFFDDGSGQEFYSKRPFAFQKDCENILLKLQEILGEYKAKATKYGLIDVEEDETGPRSGQANQPAPKDRQLSRYKDKMAAQLSELKKKAINWSIFDKASIVKMLDKFRDWTTRLRETVSWMLSTREFTDGFVPDSKAVRQMALQDVIRRQENAARVDPPTDFGPLMGFIKRPEGAEGPTGEPTLAKYSEDDDDWDDAQDFVIETRDYDTSWKEYVIQGMNDQVLQLKGAVWKLAWLLHNSTFSTGVGPDASNGPLLLSLNFVGYLDLPEKSVMIFIYELPKPNLSQRTTSITTLYSIINEKDATSGKPLRKPSLGSRFFLAHTLAMTVLNVHSSRWVHKNIWSKGVVLCSSSNTSRPLRSERLVPYLTGWGLARPDSGDTRKLPNFEIVPNLYRHPNRQGQPTTAFKSEHDIYALGVVLIEIGLWRTVDQVFSAEITKGYVAPGRMLRWWKATGCMEIESEMGERFSEVVDKCLEAKKMMPRSNAEI